MNISLPPHLETAIQQQLASGHYASPAEVIREALILLSAYKKHDTVKLAALRQAIQDGLKSGTSTPLDINDIVTKARAELANGKHGG